MIETDDAVGVVRDMFAAFDHGDRAGFKAFLAEHATWFSHATGRADHGPEEITAASWALRTAFPDLHRDFIQVFTSPERVIAEVVWSGTHRGELVTAHHVVRPTDNHVRWHACYIVTLCGDKVSSISEYYDRTGLFAQLGVLPASGSTNASKALMRRFYKEVLEEGNLASVEELISPAFVEHIPQPLPGQPTSGREAVTSFVTMLRTAIPDLQVRIDEMVADEDVVMARVTWRGTHDGSFMGIAPTGKRIEVTGFDTIHIAGDKIVEHWGQVDVLGMLGQLDFLPDLRQ